MSPLQAVILGAIQGVTEFLPISSDGHLAAASMLMHVPDMTLALTVFLHVGTLVATLLILRKDLVQLTVATFRGLRAPREYFASDEGRMAAGIVVASIPTAAIGLFLENSVEAWSAVPWIVGVCMLGTCAFLLLTRRGGGNAASPTLRQSLLIGVIQGFAVLPGLSRSGSTISTAMLVGMKPEAAFRYSFLLSLPAVFGAVVLELRHAEFWEGLSWPAYLGAAVSFGVGCGALLFLRRIVSRGNFWLFVVYLLPLALFLIAWSFV